MVATENRQGGVQLLRGAVPAREIDHGSRCPVSSGGQDYERKRSPGLQGVQHQKKIPPPHGMGKLHEGFSRKKMTAAHFPFTASPLLPAL